MIWKDVLFRFPPAASLIYPLLCLLIASPIIALVFQVLLSTPTVPPGADPSNHVSFALFIFKTGSPLIPYSQFTQLRITTDAWTGGYYPSLFHIFMALTARALFGTMPNWEQVTQIMRLSVFVGYMAGLLGFMFLSKKLLESRSVMSSCLLFGLIMYGSSPLLKTLRDGSYGEIIALWTLLPFALLFVYNKNRVASGIVIAAIIATHNLSAIIVSIILLSVIAYSFLNRSLRDRLGFPAKLLAAIVISLVLSVPSLFYFYLSTVTVVATGSSGVSQPYQLALLPGLLGPVLTLGGAVGGVMLLVLKRREGWLAIWALSMILLSQTPIFGERFAREVYLPLALSLGVLMASLPELLDRSRPELLKFASKRWVGMSVSRKKFLAAVVLGILLIGYATSNIYAITDLTQPSQEYYFSDTQRQAYEFLSRTVNIGDGIVLFAGMDNWLIPMLQDRAVLFNVLPPNGSSLSAADRIIDQQIFGILLQPELANMTILKFNLHYIVLSSPLKGRFYSGQVREMASKLITFPFENYRWFQLVFYRQGTDATVKVYAINVTAIQH